MAAPRVVTSRALASVHHARPKHSVLAHIALRGACPLHNNASLTARSPLAPPPLLVPQWTHFPPMLVRAYSTTADRAHSGRPDDETEHSLEHERVAIDEYVLGIKRQLERDGIYPVAVNPDIYIAHTPYEANRLAQLFARDRFLGMDSKLMPYAYTTNGSSLHPPYQHQHHQHRHDNFGGGEEMGDPAAPIEINLHAESPPPLPPPPPPPPRNPRYPTIDALIHAVPSDLHAMVAESMSSTASAASQSISASGGPVHTPPPPQHQSPPTHSSARLLSSPYRGLPTGANQRPVSLLQLASHHSCVLFRLRRILLHPPHAFPPTLRRLLVDRSVAKYATHAQRSVRQLSHSYAVWPGGARDIRDACVRSGVSATVHGHAAVADGTRWDELRLLFKPGPMWTVRVPADAAHDSWDWDRADLPSEWVQLAADDAFVRYLVGARLTHHGLARPFAVPAADLVLRRRFAADLSSSATSASSLSVAPPTSALTASAAGDRGQESVLANIAAYLERRRLTQAHTLLAAPNPAPLFTSGDLAHLPTVHSVAGYLVTQMQEWRVKYREGQRFRRAHDAILHQARLGNVALYSSPDALGPPVQPDLVDPRAAGLLYLRLTPASRNRKRGEPPRSEPPILLLDPVAPLNVSGNDMWETGPFRAAFVERIATAVAGSVRITHPQLVVALAAHFRPTTTRRAVTEHLLHSPIVADLPLALPGKRALVAHVMRRLELDGVLVSDRLDRDAMAWSSGDGGDHGHVAAHALIANSGGVCPRELHARVHLALRGTSAWRTNASGRAMRRSAVVNALVSGTRLVQWVRAYFGLDPKWTVDRSGAEVLAEWVLDAWARDGVVAAFYDDAGTQFVAFLANDGSSVSDPSLALAPIALPEKRQPKSSGLLEWHPAQVATLSRLSPLVDVSTVLPRVDAADVAMIMARLGKFRRPLAEIKMASLDQWLRATLPHGELVSSTLQLGVGTTELSAVQVAAIVDALVQTRCLVPSLTRGVYLINSSGDPALGPEPYRHPTVAFVRRIVLPALRARAAAVPSSSSRKDGRSHPEPLTPAVMRRVVRDTVAPHMPVPGNNDPTSGRRRPLDDPAVADVVEWCVSIMRERQWIAADPHIVVARLGDSAK
ncbi:hypothetical protein BC828DRAFT_185503 [Blastocladiella britannica]|nr:hypothetical protein BC828DRAFT_185503 [Blastocladiella britannica]